MWTKADIGRVMAAETSLLRSTEEKTRRERIRSEDIRFEDKHTGRKKFRVF
jgi:hypothetical protein